MVKIMNWKITNLEIEKSYTSEDASFDNLVIKAHWEVSSEYIDSEQVSQKVRYYDVCTLPLPEGDFIPLDQLTQEQVLDWVWANGVSKFKAEQKVLAKIEKLANPPVYTQQFEGEAIEVEPSDALEPQYEEIVEEVVEEEFPAEEEAPAEEPTEEA